LGSKCCVIKTLPKQRRASAGRCLRPGVSLLILACVVVSQLTWAQTQPSDEDEEAGRLVRQVVQSELIAQELDKALWSFRLTKRESGKDKSFIACQAVEGVVYRLLGIDGEALGPAEQEAEKKHVARFAKHRDELREYQRKAAEDAKQARKLLAAIPDALLFHREQADGDLVTMSFTPNPRFHPSGHAEAAFRHLEGTLTMDVRQERLAEFHGTLTRDVKFLGGLLGHLDKGGTLWVRQVDLGSGFWEFADIDVRMNGRILFFKTISIHQKLSYGKYERMPEATTIEEAIARVLAEAVEPAGAPN